MPIMNFNVIVGKLRTLRVDKEIERKLLHKPEFNKSGSPAGHQVRIL